MINYYLMNSIGECHSHEKYVDQILYERKEGIKNCLFMPDVKLTVINNTQIDVVSLAKILDVNISSDRK